MLRDAAEKQPALPDSLPLSAAGGGVRVQEKSPPSPILLSEFREKMPHLPGFDDALRRGIEALQEGDLSAALVAAQLCQAWSASAWQRLENYGGPEVYFRRIMRAMQSPFQLSENLVFRGEESWQWSLTLSRPKEIAQPAEAAWKDMELRPEVRDCELWVEVMVQPQGEVQSRRFRCDRLRGGSIEVSGTSEPEQVEEWSLLLGHGPQLLLRLSVPRR